MLEQARLTMIWAVRDRLLHAVFAAALAMFLLVPVFSAFSMRQVQELSLTLVLALHGLALLVIALLLGATALWREIERRYTAAVLVLPVSRSRHLLGKFLGIACFLAACGALLGLAGVPLVHWSAAVNPSEAPVNWANYAVAIGGATGRAVVVAALALLFSTIATSFFLPIFATVAVFLAGSGSQQVYEYATGTFGKDLSPAALLSIKVLYYLLPNFAAFDLQLYAIYGLPLPAEGLLLTALYALLYLAVALLLAMRLFERRELP